MPEAHAIPEGRGRSYDLGGWAVAVFNDGGTYRAIDDTCPHQGASLGEGTYHRGRVICPWHNWIFDAETGACPGVPEISVAVYPVRVRDGAVEVELP